jgi:hypothetical protein
MNAVTPSHRPGRPRRDHRHPRAPRRPGRECFRLTRPTGNTDRDSTMPPMPEHKHNPSTQFNRLDDQITGPVADAIMIYPVAGASSTCPASTARTATRPRTR